VDVNDYIHSEITDKNVLIKWDTYESIPKEYFNMTVKAPLKVIGYFVYVFSKEDGETENDGYVKDINVDSKGNTKHGNFWPTKNIKLFPNHKQSIYYTKSNCLNLPGLKAGKQYLISIMYVFQSDLSDDSNVYFYRPAGIYSTTIIDPVYIIKAPDNYNQEGNTKACSEEKLETLSISELKDRMAEFNNKFLEVEGCFSEAKGQFKDVHKRDYINCFNVNEYYLTDGNYLLAINGFNYFYDLALKDSYPNKNYARMLVYIHKIADSKVPNYKYDDYKKIISESKHPDIIPLFLKPEPNNYQCDLIHILDISKK
jgi:hypothetical protein